MHGVSNYMQNTLDIFKQIILHETRLTLTFNKFLASVFPGAPVSNIKALVGERSARLSGAPLSLEKS
jgi:hypothetical protein